MIHFKQPVKPVIILQPPKQQQRAELLFNSTDGPGTNEVDAFFQQLSKGNQANGSVTSLPSDVTMDHDSAWPGAIDGESGGHSRTTSSTAQAERSPPPYFEAMAGRLNPRSTSFSNGSLSNSSGLLKSDHNPNTSSSSGSTVSFGHRRSLSVPVMNPVVARTEELQKGQKSSSMTFNFPETEEVCDIADNYHAITQELRKVI